MQVLGEKDTLRVEIEIKEVNLKKENDENIILIESASRPNRFMFDLKLK